MDGIERVGSSAEAPGALAIEPPDVAGGGLSPYSALEWALIESFAASPAIQSITDAIESVDG